MNSQVEEIKGKTDIVSVIGGYIELKKAGRNYKANCPFHGEKTPSFMVSPELQIYKCFGCGESGDVFTFLEKQEGMEFGEALKYLADLIGIKLNTFTPAETSQKEKIIQINHSALNFYSYILHNHKDSKKVMDYLKKDRGMTQESINKFQLGYSPDKPDILFKYLKDKKGYSTADLDKSGLFAAKGRYDRFGGRVVFPLMDHRGNIVGFSGRILPWVRQDRAKYINSPETPAYSKSKILYGLNISKTNIRDAKNAIVVEGELDMISSYQAGIKNVVAIKGSALTEEQIRLISRFASKIILCLDSDFAGDAAARRGAILAENQGIEVVVSRLTGFKDPDDAARGDVVSYKKSLNNAVGIWDFLIDGIFEKYDLTGSGKTKISREVVPVISLISDKIVQAHYAELVGRRLSVPIESVMSQLGKSDEKKVQSTVISIKENSQKPRRQLLEEQLIALLLTYSPDKLQDVELIELFSTPFALRIIGEIKKIKNTKEITLTSFFKQLPNELSDKFSEIILLDLEEGEIDLVIKDLKLLKYRHTLEVLGSEISKAEMSGNEEAIGKYQKQFAQTAQKLSLLEEG